jgi:hypothetical protein
MKTTSRRSFFGHMFVASAEDSNVGIIDFAFKPAALTVKPGRMGAVHSTVGVGVIFRSTAMDANDWFSVVLDKLGDFAHFCGLFRTGNANYSPRSKRHGGVTPAPNVAIAAKTDIEKARG